MTTTDPQSAAKADTASVVEVVDVVDVADLLPQVPPGQESHTLEDALT